MTPRDVYTKACADPENTDRASWRSLSTRVRIEDLAGIVGHHTMRRVKVSTSHFGLAEISKGDVIRRLHDEYFLRNVDRVAEKGFPVEASVSISKKERVAHEAYELMIHTIGSWTGDGTIWVVP